MLKISFPAEPGALRSCRKLREQAWQSCKTQGRGDHQPFLGLTASATIATPAATISASSIKPLRV